MFSDAPGLEGEPVKRPLFASLWTPATRLVLGGVATTLAVASFVRGNPLGLVAGGGTVLALARTGTRGGHMRASSAMTATASASAVTAIASITPTNGAF